MYLKDYGHFYYQEEGEDQVLFGFQMKFNKCFVLADPIGQREKWTAATLAFMDQADLLGYQLVFLSYFGRICYESSRLRL